MNPPEFIRKIIDLYQAARIPRYVDSKISRGRSHSVASTVEDLFASYLILNDSKIERILVDQRLSINSSKHTFYPDITVIKRGKIVALFDLKMDLGYKRDRLTDLCAKDSKLVEKIIAKTCNFRDGVDKTPHSYVASKRLTYDIVIVTNQNISSAKLQRHLSDIEPYKNQVRAHVLSSGEHPNSYDFSAEELMTKISVNDSAFTDILKRI